MFVFSAMTKRRDTYKLQLPFTGTPTSGIGVSNKVASMHPSGSTFFSLAGSKTVSFCVGATSETVVKHSSRHALVPYRHQDRISPLIGESHITTMHDKFGEYRLPQGQLRVP